MKNRKGMTLIEVVVAMAIFGMIMVTIFPAFLILNLTNLVSKENVTANYVAQDTMERIYENSKSIAKVNFISSLTSAHGFTFVSTVAGVTTMTKTDSEYIQTLTVTIDNPSVDLARVKINVEAINDLTTGDQRSQIETILELGD